LGCPAERWLDGNLDLVAVKGILGGVWGLRLFRKPETTEHRPFFAYLLRVSNRYGGLWGKVRESLR
jgi:hypothetical protein